MEKSLHVSEVVDRLSRAGLSIATAESLTAGLLAARIADVPGASAVLRGGIVAYATELKTQLLGVPATLVMRVGPVDPEVASRMAQAVTRTCDSDLGVATTGVAGPQSQGDVAVGTVFVALHDKRMGETVVQGFTFAGDRAAVRNQTVEQIVLLLAEHLLANYA